MLSIQKITAIGRTYRHLNRYRQILTIFLKYGFDDLLNRLHIDQYIELGLQMITRKRRERVEKMTRAERIRIVFEELGPTFIKFGQIASTRPDLFPIEFINELSKLQDEVPAFPFDQVKSTIQQELGRPPAELFEAFDEKPIASASIGQVHRVRMTDGREAVIKVQRPNIRKTIEIDLEIMLYIASLMERHVQEFAFHRPTEIVEEFARTLGKEVDYNLEATSMERFARQFAEDLTVYVPKVYREMTTSQVITMEFVNGIKVSDVANLKAAGLDTRLITARGANLTLKQVFHNGFFHADPHPGNIFVLPGNIICLIDFGMIGTVDRQTRENFVDLLDSIVHRNSAEAAQVILRITDWEDQPDIRSLERELADFISRHLFKPLKDIEVGRLLQQLLQLVSHHRLRVPPDIFLMIKALATVEGVAKALDPQFDMVGQAAPFIARVKIARFYPERIAFDLVTLAGDLRHFLQKVPKDILDITRMIKNEKIGINVEYKGQETTLAAYHKISNRLAFSIIIAALLIGSALIVISATPPLFYGISFIGIIGFLAAAVMGIWLLVAIVRKGL
ncbi:MAG: ABC1 kinase family protein [Thermodesulfobacteriota bacterium]